MKKLILFAFALMVSVMGYSQKITFYSPEFEKGVKHHIGLGEDEDVLQTQTDTITSIDLSRLGMADIRDVVYLSNVQRLNLAHNKISDISPLLALESLEVLDLNWNLLEDISELVFASSYRMQVNVAYNYIQDFGFVLSSPAHHFNIVGVGAQRVKDAPYFDVYQLMVCYGEDDTPVVYYRGKTNMGSSATLSCQDSQVGANMDGGAYLVAVPGNPTATAAVTLSNGEKSEQTYVVPVADYVAAGGETVTMDTGLPEHYILTSAYASKGTVEIEGSTLKYTAPETAESDVINFCYYQGATLKGFSRFYLNRGNLPGDVNGDGNVTVTDAVMILSYILGERPTSFDPTAADINHDGSITIADVVSLINLIQ